MSSRKWLGAGVGVAALILMVLLLFPAVQSMVGRRTEAPNAPNFNSTIRVAGPRVVLPPAVPGAAAVYFVLSNTGSNTVHLTQVAAEHATKVRMTDTGTPGGTALSNIPVHPGETVSFGPNGRYALAADYDANMVPGAEVRLTLTFDTSGTISLPATVQAGTGANGTAGPGVKRQEQKR